MRQKSLGRCGLIVSEIGFGARWLVSKGKTEAETALAEKALLLALESGVTLVDTAAGYGDSEQRVGRILKKIKGEITVSTKCWASDEKKIRASLEQSLENLGRSSIDIYLIHNPEDTFAALPVFKKLREEGLVRAVGVCAWHGDEDLMKRAIEEGAADILQIAVTLLHRGMIEKGVVDLAVKNHLGIQIMSPLAKGRLAGAHPALKPLEPFGIRTLSQASLKYLVDHIPNGVPIPGTSKPERVREYLSVADLPIVPEEAWLTVIRELEKNPELIELP